MPFTPSHAVVALPFIRTPLIPAAIAVGAMTPDLPLFVRGLPLTYGLLHSNVLVAMLVAAALLAVWYWALRPAARELSPAFLARRLPSAWDAMGLDVWRAISAPRRGARSAIWREELGLLIALSLFLGVVSHVVWDAFTHDGRWGVELFPALDAMWGPLPGYKWLQHGSSVIGLAIIGVWAVLWLARAEVATSLVRTLPAWVRWAWWISLPIVLIAAWAAGLAVLGPLGDDFTVAHLAYRVLPVACAWWAGATLLLCIAVQLLRARAAARVRAGE